MIMPAVTTAEWNCTRCGVTNRKLVPVNAPEAKDRCVSCRVRHVISPDDRPVRWRSRAA
jgi:hypothetical protein